MSRLSDPFHVSGLRRRMALLIAILLPLLLPLPQAWSADQDVVTETVTISAADAAAAAAKTPPIYDRNMMMFGCMGGLAVGALSTILPPVAGWAVAGVWMGGLGTMVVRAAFGCVYGGLAGAVASTAQVTFLWLESQWRQFHNPAPPVPLPIEGPGGS